MTLTERIKAITQLSSTSVRCGQVWGFGVAFSVCGPSIVTDDWKWVGRTVEWKLYLGPVMVSGWFPWSIKRGEEPTYCRKNNL